MITAEQALAASRRCCFETEYKNNPDLKRIERAIDKANAEDKTLITEGIAYISKSEAEYINKVLNNHGYHSSFGAVEDGYLFVIDWGGAWK